MIFEYNCVVCGKFVRKHRSPANTFTTPKYCSQKCNGIARRKDGPRSIPNHRFNCEQCGKEVATYRSPSASDPKFCSVQCTGLAQRGENNPSYSGGRHRLNTGYIVRLCPSHPNADSRGYVLEHRLVMEDKLGRLLTSDEVVHHIDHDRTNNDPDNLMLFSSQSEHTLFHKQERANNECH